MPKVISTSSTLDVLGKQKSLMAQAMGADSPYIRAKETLEELFKDNTIKNTDRAKVIAETISGITNSITTSTMSTALDWEYREKELSLRKEELSYQLDLLETQNKKAEADVKVSDSSRYLNEAKIIREYGVPTFANDKVVSLSDDGVQYASQENIKQETLNRVELNTQIKSQTKEVDVRIHKQIGESYYNYGIFDSYTITDSGVSNVTKLTTGQKTLSEAQLETAKEQAKGYALNAYSNAATSSASMIGVLVSSESAVDYTPYLTKWSSSIDKLNNVTLPVLT